VTLRLRPFQPEQDSQVLLELRSDSDLQHLLMAHPDPLAIVDLQEWVLRRQARGWFRVIETEDGSTIGFAQLSDWHRIDSYAWVGIAIHPDWQGRGWGRMAMYSLAEEAHCHLELRKLLLQVRADNVHALHLYTGLGYRRVGLFREHYYDGSNYHDVIVMELLLSHP
jgi:putative acetyltransferase